MLCRLFDGSLFFSQPENLGEPFCCFSSLYWLKPIQKFANFGIYPYGKDMPDEIPESLAVRPISQATSMEFSV